MKNYFVAILLLGLIGSVQAQQTSPPVSQLPKHIKPVAGMVVLVADYDHKDGQGKVPVYLINATKKAVTLRAQDGDVYLKLEVKGADGKWRRAQPHAYSW